MEDYTHALCFTRDELESHAADLQRRLDEARQVLADLREERGLAAFREWLAGQLAHRVAEDKRLAPRRRDGLVLDTHATGAWREALAEFDRRFGVKP